MSNLQANLVGSTVFNTYAEPLLTTFTTTTLVTTLKQEIRLLQKPPNYLIVPLLLPFLASLFSTKQPEGELC